jgi:hypothetical protein
VSCDVSSHQMSLFGCMNPVSCYFLKGLRFSCFGIISRDPWWLSDGSVKPRFVQNPVYGPISII